MKKKFCLSVCLVIVGFLLGSCAGEEGDSGVVPVLPDKTADEIVELGFNYRGTDKRPLLSCDSYTASEKQVLGEELVAAISKMKTKRGRTVAAAAFLAGLDYCIPYSYEWIIPEPGYGLVGRYTRKGLFLNDVTEMEKGVMVTYPAWGRMVPTHERYPRETIEGLGDFYENGFHCSSFLAWCFFNADAITDVTLLDATYANDYRKFPKSREFSLKGALESIRIGDLLWFDGHVAIVIGVDGDTVIYASGEGGAAHTPARGVRWRTFSKRNTNYETFAYKSLIQMKGVYGD